MMTALAGAGRYLTLPVGSTRPENLWLARALTAFVMLALLFAGFWLIPQMAHAQDAGGADTLAADPGSAVNFAWTLLAGALVFFMQAGFALLGAGLIRSKNTVSYMTKGFMGFAVASLAYWAFGFAFMFGGAGGFGLETGGAFIGGSGFFLAGDAYDVSTITRWFFQVVLAATAALFKAGGAVTATLGAPPSASGCGPPAGTSGSTWPELHAAARSTAATTIAAARTDFTATTVPTQSS